MRTIPKIGFTFFSQLGLCLCWFSAFILEVYPIGFSPVLEIGIMRQLPHDW